MKIKPDQLSKNLSNGLESLYFLFGSEILLVEQSLALIKQVAKENDFSDRVRFDIDGLFPWDTINSEMASPSLFTQKRIIECRLTTGKIGIKGSKALTELVDTLPDDILLIISTGKLDMNQQKSKWFKALDKKGVIIQHWEVQNEHLVGWITSQMTQLGLKTNKEVTEAIAYYTEGNLLASMQEIQKLQIAYPDGHIIADEVLNQIEQKSHYSVYGLIDAALKGDSTKVNKIFNSLVDETTPPVIIISSLYREIKSLITMSVQLKHNESIEAVLAKHQVWQKRKPLISNALKKYPYQQLQKLLLSLGRIDRSVKGMDNLNVYDELRSVLITLAGKTQWTQ